MSNYSDIIRAAQTRIGAKCKACAVCDGRACSNHIPGPGSKGIGDTAIRNYEKWKEIRVVMDTISNSNNPDPSFSAFGKVFKFPLFAGPVGAVDQHYSDAYDDLRYNSVLLRACAEAGIAAFTGDGINPKVMESAAQALIETDGIGIPTIKPWNMDLIRDKLSLVLSSGCFAVAMDVDAAGLPFLQGLTPSAGCKSTNEMREIIKMSARPFIIKGIMSIKGAEKAYKAGASAIVVSNHGGRVLDQCAATAEVLPEIADAMKGSGMHIFVDGGIRSGTDIFKAIAAGADAVLIARPYVVSVYGGGETGAKLYTEKLYKEFVDSMQMCGAASLHEICRDMIRLPQSS